MGENRFWDLDFTFVCCNGDNDDDGDGDDDDNDGMMMVRMTMMGMMIMMISHLVVSVVVGGCVVLDIHCKSTIITLNNIWREVHYFVCAILPCNDYFVIRI